MTQNTPNKYDFDTRPERPAHVPEPLPDYAPTCDNADGRVLARNMMIAIFLIGVAAIIVYLVR